MSVRLTRAIHADSTGKFFCVPITKNTTAKGLVFSIDGYYTNTKHMGVERPKKHFSFKATVHCSSLGIPIMSVTPQ